MADSNGKDRAKGGQAKNGPGEGKKVNMAIPNPDSPGHRHITPCRPCTIWGSHTYTALPAPAGMPASLPPKQNTNETWRTTARSSPSPSWAMVFVLPIAFGCARSTHQGNPRQVPRQGRLTHNCEPTQPRQSSLQHHVGAHVRGRPPKPKSVQDTQTASHVAHTTGPPCTVTRRRGLYEPTRHEYTMRPTTATASRPAQRHRRKTGDLERARRLGHSKPTTLGQHTAPR